MSRVTAVLSTIIILFIPGLLIGQSHDFPCDADADPVTGWPPSEFTQILSGDLSGVSPFVTDNAMGDIQNFGIAGADSSLFYKLEIDESASHITINFQSGTASNISIGLVGIDNPCPPGGSIDYEEELYSNVSGETLLHSSFNVSSSVTFPLCALDTDDYDNIFLWVASSTFGVGDYTFQVTQRIPPDNPSCTASETLGRLHPDQEICITGDNSWSCPSHITDGSACLTMLSQSGYAVSWYTIGTQEYTNQLEFNLSHTGMRETVISLISSETGCGGDFEELFCEILPNGQMVDFQFEVDPNKNYYVLVATEVDNGRPFDLCIAGQFVCRMVPGLAPCVCTTEPLCSADELDNFCFSMVDYTTDWPDFPGCPATQFNNPHWFSFVGGGEPIVLRMRSFGCEDLGGGVGIRVAVYTSEIPNLQPYCLNCIPERQQLRPVFSMCDCTTDPVDIVIPSTYGRTYYVVVDGCSGSICDVVLDVVSGGDPPDVDDFDLDDFSDPMVEFFNDVDTVCTFAEDVTIDVMAPFGASVLEYVIGGGIPEYSLVNFLNYESTIEIPNSHFEQEGSVLFCVRAYNDCGSSTDQICKEIFVRDVVPHEVVDSVCRWEPYIWRDMFGDVIDTIPAQDLSGNYFYVDSLFGNYSCKQDLYLDLFVRPNNELNPTLEIATICEGESYEYFGNTYTETGQYLRIIEDQYGCDSFVNLVLLVLNGDVILDEITCLYNDFSICPTQEFFTPDPLNFGLNQPLEITHEWYQLSTETLLSTGTGGDRCLNVNLGQLNDDIDSFALHIFLQYDGEPVDPGCTFGPFVIELDTDDFYPGEPELTEPEPACIGDTIIISAEVNQMGVEVYYDWEFEGISLFNYEIISGFNESDLEIVFHQGGNFGVCVSSFNTCLFGDIDCSQITIIDPADIYAGPDTTLCGLNYTLMSSGETGVWTVLSTPTDANINFSDASDPQSEIQVSEGGDYILEWTEITPNLEHCSSSDTVTISLIESPSIARIDFSCDSLQLNYQATFEILGDHSPFEILTQNGTIDGNLFTSDPTPSGNLLEVVLSNQLGCLSDTIRISRNCNCITTLGNFDNNPSDLCEGDCLDAFTFYNQNDQIYAPGLDTVNYILQTQATFSNDPDHLISINTDGVFCFEDLMLESGEPYYLYIVLGRFNAQGFVDLDEECTVISQGKPLVWHSIPIAIAGEDQNICGVNGTLGAEPSLGTGQWSVLSGPGEAVFTDSFNPNSSVEVDQCGDYVFQWVESNFNCADSAIVNITFNCSPEVVSGSLAIECTSDDFYSVSFMLENGLEPYSELNGKGSFTGSLFEIEDIPAGTRDTFFIQDANGCELVVPVLRNCDCESYSGELSNQIIENCESDPQIEVGTFEVIPFLDEDDIGIFVLHDSPGNQIGNIISSNSSGIFDFDENSMDCGVTYYLSHVVGDSLLSGGIDWDDSCLSVSAGQPVRWTCIPQPDAGADDESCGLTYQLEASPIDVAGSWEAIPFVGVVFDDLSSPQTAVEVPEFGEYCFTWTAVDGECTGSATVCITFLDSPELVPGSLEIDCDSTATFYTVSFSLQGGDMSTYQVDGGGELDGSLFTSNPISVGDSYVFSIYDQYSCQIIEVSGQGDCDCISQAGVLSGAEQNLCVDEPVSPGAFNYDSSGEQLDGDDIRVFLLATEFNPSESDLIDQNLTGEFNFDSQLGMATGVTYWILVAVGDEISPGNVNFNDACLSFSQAIPVVWHDPPEIDIPDRDYIITCDLPIISIEVNPLEDHYSYNWTTPDGDIVAGTQSLRTVEVQSAGTYTVTVRDNISGCESTTSVEVLLSDDLPEVQILLPDTLNCTIETVQLDGSNSSSGNPFSFNWEGPGVINGDSALIISVDLPGVYTLTIVNDDTACSVSSTVTVHEDRNYPEAVASVEDELNCSNETIIIYGHGSSEGPGIVYQWSALDSTAQILSGHQNMEAVVNSRGLYQLIVTNSINGCSDTATVQVTENLDVITSVEVSSGGIICPGDSDGFIFIESVEGGTPPYRYSFDAGNSFGTNPMATGLNPGNYSIVVEDAAGCTLGNNITLSEPPPFIVDLGPDLVVEPGTVVILEAEVNKNEDSIVSWVWEPMLDPDCANCPSQQFTPDQSMNISLVVMDTDGCIARDEIYLRIFGQNNIYIPNAFSPNSDGINDLFGVFSEEGSINKINEFRIFDRWGEQVFSRSSLEPSTELNSNNAWDGNYNGEKMQSGVYVYYFIILFEDGTEEVFQGEVTLIR